MPTIKVIIAALRCTLSVNKNLECADCPYRVLERCKEEIAWPKDVTIDGVDYWESCNCDQICKDAADALEQYASAKRDRVWDPYTKHNDDDATHIMQPERWLGVR